MGVILEADLNTCLRTLESSSKAAAEGDRAEQSRMLDVLKQLRTRTVTADLLKRTNAGKRLNKFCKHECSAVGEAAKAAVEAWKACVKQAQHQGEATPQDAEARAEANAPPPAAAPAAAGRASEPARGSGAAGTSAPDAPLQRQPSASRPAAAGKGSEAGGGSGGFVVDPPRCGNDTRDKVRSMLAEALAVGYTGGGGGGSGSGEAGGALQSPNLLAAAIEDALRELFGGVGGEYKSKARSLCFNLKDARNPDLRERVLCGSVPPEALVRMSAEEMASDEQKRRNKELKDWLAKEATRGNNNTATTDMFQCGRCKQRKCTYYQLQTRSADEPMTTFVTCTNCGQRWKFC